MVCVISFPVGAFSDTFPSNAPIAGGVYIHANVTALGDVIIFVPVDYKDGFFSLTRGSSDLVNIGNTTITCNMYAGYNYNMYYQARFTRFNTLEYYNNYTGTLYRWEPMIVNTIYNTNLTIVDNNSTTAIRQISLDFIIQIVTVVILGMILILIMIKRN